MDIRRQRERGHLTLMRKRHFNLKREAIVESDREKSDMRITTLVLSRGCITVSQVEFPQIIYPPPFSQLNTRLVSSLRVLTHFRNCLLRCVKRKTNLVESSLKQIHVDEFVKLHQKLDGGLKLSHTTLESTITTGHSGAMSYEASDVAANQFICLNTLKLQNPF